MKSKRLAFTLVELLVVIAIIGVLVAILLPAVQAAREAARRTACTNNIRQMALALANYQSARRHYPSSVDWDYGVTSSKDFSWSIQAKILPYLEEGGIYAHINFNLPYNNTLMPDGSKLQATGIAPYLCPSEPNNHVRKDASGAPEHFPLSYVVNLGTWEVLNPMERRGGDGAFTPMRQGVKAFKDGMSKTLALAEVKTYNPYYRNAGRGEMPIPSSSGEFCGAGDFKVNSGHTEWVDARAHQTGFTTVFGPNTKVLCSQAGGEYDVDWTNMQEGKSLSKVTYAAVTARSHHTGAVNTAFMDGSVHLINDEIDLRVWRAMGTRAGGEVVPSDF